MNADVPPPMAAWYSGPSPMYGQRLTACEYEQLQRRQLRFVDDATEKSA
jgi:hypothetical protein